LSLSALGISTDKHDRCGVCRGRLSAAGRRVELGHELAVGCAGSGEILLAVLVPETQIDDVLLEDLVLVTERIDVGGCAESRFMPGLFAEHAGETAFEWLDASGEARCSLLGVEQVGLQ
jgi:hypothetical protein